MNTRTQYVTFNGRIPSRKADSVAVMQTCSAFAAEGWQMELLIPQGMAAEWSELNATGPIWDFYGVDPTFEIIRLPTLVPLSVSLKAGLSIYSVVAARRAYLSRSDVVYSREVETAVLCTWLGRRVVFESHNYNRNATHPLFGRLIRLLAHPDRPVALVTTTSASAAAYRRDGVPEEKIIIESNGVDLPRFALDESVSAVRVRLGLAAGKPIVTFSGNLYPGRGVEELIAAAVSIPSAHFLFVGGFPEDVTRCKACAEERDAANVQFIGYVPPRDVADYLLASDILVMPYTSDTSSHRTMSPMKMFDYLAAGRAIVATDFPVINEVLTHGENAFLVSPDDPYALSAGIRHLVENPAVATRLGQEAKKEAGQHSWRARAERIVTWVGELECMRWS